MGFGNLISNTFGKVITQASRTMGGTISSQITRGVPKAAASILNPAIISAVGKASELAGNYLTGAINKFSQKNVNQAYSTQIKNVPGLANQVARYVFEAGTTPTTVTTHPLEYSGYGPDVTGQVPNEYIIKVRNTKNWIIKGVMQEAFKISVGSKWDSLVPTNFGTLVNAVTQITTGRTLLTKWMTRRMWVGTTPLNFQVTLKFNAVKDEWSEVVRPCMRLQQMAMPSLPGKTGSIYDLIPLIQPPGPSPFNLGEFINPTQGGSTSLPDPTLVNNVFTGAGDRIIIEIGKFIRFDNVILTKVDVAYSPRLTKMGFPINSIATISFETYEMMTLEDLETAHVRKG
jgi:hypothetical protein